MVFSLEVKDALLNETYQVDAVATFIFSDERRVSDVSINTRFSNEIKQGDSSPPVNRFHRQDEMIEQFIDQIQKINDSQAQRYILPVQTEHFTAFCRLWVLLKGQPVVSSTGLTANLALAISMHYSSPSSSMSSDLPKSLFSMEFTFRICEKIPEEVYKTSITQSFDAAAKDDKWDSYSVFLGSNEGDIDNSQIPQKVAPQKGLAFDSRPVYVFTQPFCSNLYTSSPFASGQSDVTLDILNSLGLENQGVPDYFHELFSMMGAKQIPSTVNTDGNSGVGVVAAADDVYAYDHLVQCQVQKEFEQYKQMCKIRTNLQYSYEASSMQRTNTTTDPGSSSATVSEQSIPPVVIHTSMDLFQSSHHAKEAQKQGELQEESDLMKTLVSLDTCVELFRTALEKKCSLRSFQDIPHPGTNANANAKFKANKGLASSQMSQTSCWIHHALTSKAVASQLKQYKGKKLYLYASPCFSYQERPTIAQCQLHPQLNNIYMDAEYFQANCLQETLKITIVDPEDPDLSSASGSTTAATHTQTYTHTLARPLNVVAWAKLLFIDGKFRLMNMDLSVHPCDEVANPHFFSVLRRSLKSYVKQLKSLSATYEDLVDESSANIIEKVFPALVPASTVESLRFKPDYPEHVAPVVECHFPESSRLHSATTHAAPVVDVDCHSPLWIDRRMELVDPATITGTGTTGTNEAPIVNVNIPDSSTSTTGDSGSSSSPEAPIVEGGGGSTSTSTDLPTNTTTNTTPPSSVPVPSAVKSRLNFKTHSIPIPDVVSRQMQIRPGTTLSMPTPVVRREVISTSSTARTGTSCKETSSRASNRVQYTVLPKAVNQKSSTTAQPPSQPRPQLVVNDRRQSQQTSPRLLQSTFEVFSRF